MAGVLIPENNRLTIGEQKNAIQNIYNLLLTEFRHMVLFWGHSHQDLDF